MSDFGEYVRGKTIAVVGPAPAPHDQAAEVDAHDLVIRTSYGFSAQPGWKHLRSDYVPGVFPAGYGTRVDVSYYNSGATRMAREGRLDAALADLDWALWKDRETPLPDRGLCHEMRAMRPRRNGRIINVNQVTGILWHLNHFEPADVTVYGADFYTGPIESWYDPAYMNKVHLRSVQEHVKAIRQHNQETQRYVIRAVRARHGWPSGDDRFLNALDMTSEEHHALAEQILATAPDT